MVVEVTSRDDIPARLVEEDAIPGWTFSLGLLLGTVVAVSVCFIGVRHGYRSGPTPRVIIDGRIAICVKHGNLLICSPDDVQPGAPA